MSFTEVGVILISLSGLLLVIIYTIASEYEDGYKQGQIDAANGKQKYTLVKDNDGQMVWEEKMFDFENDNQ